MSGETGRILKVSEVEFEGTVTIELSPIAASPAAAQNTGSVPQSVNIVENTPEFALVEVTCSCGTKTLIKCQYPAATEATESSPAE